MFQQMIFLQPHFRSRLATAAVLATSAAAFATPFTAGNVVGLRVGTGAAAPTANAAAIFLEEYNAVTSSTLVQLVAVPATGTSGNRLTVSGSANTEAQINLSADGRYLLIGGYDADAGTAGVVAADPGTVPRAVCRVPVADASLLDCSTRMTTPTEWTGSNIRSVTSSNGTDIWAAGGGGPINAGVQYTTFGTNGPSSAILASPINARNVHIFNGQLFASNSTTVMQVSGGLPTTGGQTTSTLFSTANDIRGWALESFTTATAGGVLWAADALAARRLVKWSYDGVVWTATDNWGTVNQNPLGCDIGLDPTGQPLVFIGQGTASPSSSIRMTDRLTNNATSTTIVTGNGTDKVQMFYRDVAYIKLIARNSARLNPLFATTNAASVDFQVTFNGDSSGVTGVDASDFTLTATGGIAGAVITGVTGSGNTYTVSVNTGTGDGTLRLNVLDDDTIQDTHGNKLGGNGTVLYAGSGAFSGGEVYNINKSFTDADNWELYQ